MKHAKLLMGIIVLCTILVISACAPWFHGDPHRALRGPKLSAHELFSNADNMLSKEEFENSLP